MKHLALFWNSDEKKIVVRDVSHIPYGKHDWIDKVRVEQNNLFNLIHIPEDINILTVRNDLT